TRQNGTRTLGAFFATVTAGVHQQGSKSTSRSVSELPARVTCPQTLSTPPSAGSRIATGRVTCRKSLADLLLQLLNLIRKLRNLLRQPSDCLDDLLKRGIRLRDRTRIEDGV